MNFIRSRRSPRSVKDAELGHFTLLVSNETYKDSLVCSLNLLFGDVLVAAVVVVCLRTFAPKNFPHTDFFKTLTDGRKL